MFRAVRFWRWSRQRRVPTGGRCGFVPCLEALEVRETPTVSLDFAFDLGTPDDEISASITTDTAGNFYITGTIGSGTVDFDPGTGTANRTGNGVYVAKYADDGTLAWVRLFAGNSPAFYASDIAVDGAGNVYTTGSLDGSVDFDPGSGTTTLGPPTGQQDTYISKLDSSGNFVWAKELAGSDSIGGVAPSSMTLDAAGNVYITGGFVGAVDFDPNGGTTSLNTGGSEDIFTLKLDTNGNLAWVREMTCTFFAQGNGIGLDSSGNIYLSGQFVGTTDFDPGPGDASLDSSNGSGFLEKLDSAGNYVWATQLPADCYDLAVDSAGNMVTTGAFTGSADFDPGAGVTTLNSAGGADIFVVKFNTSGNLVFAAAMGGSQDEETGVAPAIDAAGNVYTLGFFNGDADFDPGAGNSVLSDPGHAIFVSQLSSTGQFVGAWKLGTTENFISEAIALDSNNNIYTTGANTGGDFDPNAGVYNLSNAGNLDIFVCKLTNLIPSVTITESGGSTDVSESGITDTYTVVLHARPSSDVTITLNPGTQLNVSPSTLVFTSVNWSSARTVTVSAIDDSVIEGPHTGTITHTARSGDPAYDGLAIADVTANITDNDFPPPGVTIAETGGSTDVAEGGATDSYTVVLNTRPTSSVVITINPGSQLNVSPTSLTFTVGNWATAQLVTVSAIDDTVSEGNHTGTITHTASSGDGGYNGIAIADVTASITDNDLPGVIFSPASRVLTILEGTSRTYTAMLNAAPTSPVTLNLSPDPQVSVAPNVLTFNAGNWNVPQIVTVTAVNNTLADGNRTVAIGHTIASLDARFASVIVPSMSVNIIDDDSSLIVAGTPGADRINVLFAPNPIQVVVNGKATFYGTAFSQVIILPGNGNDVIQFANPILPVLIFGGAGTDQVIIDGLPSANAFSVDSSSIAINGKSVTFTDTENVTLNGKSAADTLTVLAAPTFALNFQAGSGSDRIIGPDQASTWKLTGSDAGNLDGTISYSSVENLSGGSADDSFVFGTGKVVSGVIDGDGGTNTLDYSAYKTPITANLQTSAITGTKGFRNIATLIGGSASDKLIGPNLTNTWNVTAWNVGIIAGLSFRGFENLTGGTGTDTFLLADAQGTKGQIDGGGGIDTLDYSSYLAAAVTVNLQIKTATNTGGFANIEQFQGGARTDTFIGANRANTWDLTGSDAGTVTGAIFTGFENLTGGTLSDVFNVSVAANWLGLLDGAAGADVLNAFAGSVYTTTGPGAGTLNGHIFKGIETRR